MRLSAIGDVCHALPMVRAIRRQFGDASITWIIGETEHGLLGDIPGIEFITVNKSNGWRAWRGLHRALSRRHFDCLLQTQYALRASLLGTALRARQRVGYDRRRARDLQWLFCNRQIEYRPDEHVMDAHMGFARWLGVRDLTPVWDIPIPGPARAFASETLGDERDYAVISPAASSASRNWLTSRYAEVIERLRRDFELTVVLTSSPTSRETRLCAEIEARTDCPVINLAGCTSLKQLLAVISAARFLIAPDSGPAHMGTAAGIPVIGLYAASNPARTGPYRSMDFTVNHYPRMLREVYGKSPEQVRFGTRIRKGRPMASIQVADVMAKVQLVMRTTQEGGARRAASSRSELNS